MFAKRTDWPLDPNPLSKLVEERRRQALPFLDLTESNPTRCGFAYNSTEILSALCNPRALAYEPNPRGLPSARGAVARYYGARGVAVDPAQIFLTTSTSEAYSYVFRLVANPGDNILVPRPSYPLLDFLARLDDVELVPYPLVYDQGWRIDLEGLGSSVRPRTRAVVLIHPNNPTGSFIHEEEFHFLVSLCAERGLSMISDEVFVDYPLKPDGTRVVSCFTPQILSFTLSGLSKVCGLPQMKLAWLMANGPAEHLREALARLEVISDTYLSLSAPLAHALPRLLEIRHEVQPQILERVRSNLNLIDAQLSRHPLVTRLETEGGWYATLKLPSTRSDEEWALEILREGALVHPGHYYDFPSEGHLVLSLLPPPETLEEGMRKLIARVGQNS